VNLNARDSQERLDLTIFNGPRKGSKKKQEGGAINSEKKSGNIMISKGLVFKVRQSLGSAIKGGRRSPSELGLKKGASFASE